MADGSQLLSASRRDVLAGAGLDDDFFNAEFAGKTVTMKAALKGIKKMSEQLNKNPGQVPVPSGIAQLNVLESLYTVTNPQELHDAIVACRLQRTDEPAAPESYALPDLDPH